jgi:hypothetical protein
MEVDDLDALESVGESKFVTHPITEAAGRRSAEWIFLF